jgi:murein DD-endopeptidase MepM/ murein hydrolase activator NlpD
MKKYTVMLIPHDRSSTRTLTLSNLHLWVVIALLVGLTFSTAFFFARHQAVAQKARKLREINRALEIENARKPEAVKETGSSDADLRAVEAKLRAEYETSLDAITTELTDLYDMEAKAREITGMAPRAPKAKRLPAATGNGKGGSPGGPLSSFVVSASTSRTRPPQVIYGMSRPSADLVLQEIHLRTRSFKELVDDMGVEMDRIARVPSIWPLAGGTGHISSSFGYRRDPFNMRVRHHDGTDISAAYGTRVRATAKGKVIETGHDRFMGNVVKIDHGNGLESWYGHLSKILVKTGEVVTRETIIGRVGSTGRSTGSHLHYEIHKGGQAVDSGKYLTD